MQLDATGRIRPCRSEAGMSTAEYAVGTLGVCTIAAVLIRLGQGEWFHDLVESILGVALDPLTLVKHVRSSHPFAPLR